MAAVIQPFLYSVNVFFFIMKISKLKSTENNIMSVCVTPPNLTMLTFYHICSNLFVVLNIVDRIKTLFVPISFYPFSILPIGNHYSEIDVYYFCTCFIPFLHMYVSIKNMQSFVCFKLCTISLLFLHVLCSFHFHSVLF